MYWPSQKIIFVLGYYSSCLKVGNTNLQIITVSIFKSLLPIHWFAVRIEAFQLIFSEFDSKISRNQPWPFIAYDLARVPFILT